MSERSGAQPRRRIRRALWRGLLAGSLGLLVVAAPVVGMTWAREDAPAHAAPLPTAHTQGDDGADDAGPRHAAAGGEEGFVGVLLPPQMANLSVHSEETVLAVPVKVGAFVEKGDVVVAFDLRLPRHELAIAVAQLAETRAEANGAAAQLAAARTRASRRTATVDVDGKAVALVSGEEAAQSSYDMQAAQAKLDSASARIAEMTAKIAQLQLSLHENELRAPFAGTVSAVLLEPGATAHAGEVVARIVGGHGLRLRMAVPEDDAALLTTAKRARLTVDGRPDRALFANIDQIPPEPDPVTRTFLVEGVVDDADVAANGGALLAGRAVRSWLIAP